VSDNKLKVLKSLFIPSDVMPISMVLIGIIITVFIPEIAIKLIGVSISLLGAVVLLMKLTTRMSSAVESKFKTNPPPNFKITVKKSPEAVRQVIENFDEDDEVAEKTATKEAIPNVAPIQKEVKDTMGDEEGFRIISKDPSPAQETKTEVSAKTSEPTPEDTSEPSSETDKPVTQNKPLVNNADKFKTTHSTNVNRFRKREIDIPTQGLLEEMPLLKEHPDQEFEFFINRILMAIRSVSNTRTAAFFFYNEYKNEIILNSYASDSKKLVGLKSKFISSNDIISQIAKSMKPEILSDINPAAELDLLPYYKSSSGTNSFIGIPVIYDKNVIGVLTADSKHSDAYDTVMVNFLSHFAKMISGLIRSYSDKYELVQDSKYLNILNKFDTINATQSSKKVYDELTDSVFSTFSCQNVYSIEFDKKNNIYKIVSSAKSDNSGYEEGFEFYNDNSILTEAILNNTDIHIPQTDSSLIRINEGETATGSYFFVVPIATNLDVYGALAIEGKRGSILEKSEQTFLKSLVKKCGRVIENLQLVDIISSGFDRDPESGLLTSTSIRKEIEREIKRVSTHNYSSSVASISFDKYKSIDDANEYVNDTIIKHINQFIEPTLDTLDLKGKQDDNLIVILSGKNSQSSKLWAERIRNKIASESVYLADKRYNITVSIGICELQPNSSCQEIMKNTFDALEVSKQKANTVSVYS
jgi:diguanylate cyclase (GGDEF)-like protein